MIGIGYVFTGQPVEAPTHPAHYNFPPRGSVVTARTQRNLFAMAPDGFEWVLLADVPVWTPTGRYFKEICK